MVLGLARVHQVRSPLQTKSNRLSKKPPCEILRRATAKSFCHDLLPSVLQLIYSQPEHSKISCIELGNLMPTLYQIYTRPRRSTAFRENREALSERLKGAKAHAKSEHWRIAGIAIEIHSADYRICLTTECQVRALSTWRKFSNLQFFFKWNVKGKNSL